MHAVDALLRVSSRSAMWVQVPRDLPAEFPGYKMRHASEVDQLGYKLNPYDRDTLASRGRCHWATIQDLTCIINITSYFTDSLFILCWLRRRETFWLSH